MKYILMRVILATWDFCLMENLLTHHKIEIDKGILNELQELSKMNFDFEKSFVRDFKKINSKDLANALSGRVRL